MIGVSTFSIAHQRRKIMYKMKTVIGLIIATILTTSVALPALAQDAGDPNAIKIF